jgi:hypothetical protein
LESLLASRAFAETPQIRQNLICDSATLVRNSNYDVLCCFANQYLDGRELRIFRPALLDDGLDGVAQKFADDVLEMTEDVGECRIKMTIHLDFRDLDVRAVGVLDEFLGCFSTVFDYLFRITAQEDLANGLLVRRRVLGLGKMPG